MSLSSGRLLWLVRRDLGRVCSVFDCVDGRRPFYDLLAVGSGDDWYVDVVGRNFSPSELVEFRELAVSLGGVAVRARFRESLFSRLLRLNRVVVAYERV